jgi:hypothetical protein
MAFELYQLHVLLATPLGAVNAGLVPFEVSEHFGCKQSFAYLSSDSLKHILKKHPETDLLDLLCMPDMVQSGLWIADRPNAACVIYKRPDTGLLYASGLKVAGEGYELYMGSFYRITERQIASKRGRGAVLREHL